MESEITYYFPWVRKGLGAYINEKENLNGSAKGRAELEVQSNYTVQQILPEGTTGTGNSDRFLVKTVKFVGPGDILRVNPSAVMKIHPDADSEGFPVQYLPYIEFWEPDFLWRYTPASPDQDKLRPWLSLIVCRQEDIQLRSLSDGLCYFTFIGNDDAWNASFLNVDELFRCAHAQGRKKDEPEFCRLLALRNKKDMEDDTDYVALLIPTYETGRLRGLGYSEEDINGIAAQKPAWENIFSDQKTKRTQGMDFPVYYKWFFRTGKNDFDTIVTNLGVSKVEKPGLVLDVTDMGEGFSYDTVEHGYSRPSIMMPAATLTVDYKKEPAFPAKDSPEFSTEDILYDNLEWMMKNNPVFAENKANSEGKDVEEDPGDEDPWIVPPAYGARHAMSFQIDDPEKPWLQELNMDIHYRASAGLGRSIVQKHQEELVDRAWKQVEAVQALNMELYRRLLSIQTNKSLQRKTVDQYASDGDNAKYIEYMMRYLSAMRNAGAEKISLLDILQDAGIPASFASASFQNNTEKLSRYVTKLDSSTLMDHIVKDQLFRFTNAEPAGALDTEVMARWCLFAQESLTFLAFKNKWSNYFSPLCKSGEGIVKVGVKQKAINQISFSHTPYDAVIQYLTREAKQMKIDDVEVETGCYDFGEVYYTVQAFSPEETTLHPRLYVMDNGSFDSFCKKGGASLVESNGKLTFRDSSFHDLSVKALSIPKDLYEEFFGNADLANTGEGQYSYFCMEKLNARNDIKAWRVFPAEKKVTGTTASFYDQKRLVHTPGNITMSQGWSEGYDYEAIYFLKRYLNSSINRLRAKHYDVFKEFREFMYAQFVEYGADPRAFVQTLKDYGIDRDYNDYQWNTLRDTLWGEGPSYRDEVNLLLNFMASFLYRLLHKGDLFCKIWNSALELHGYKEGGTLLSSLCYNERFGAWFLSMLPQVIFSESFTIRRNMLDGLFRIHTYLANNPALIIVPQKTVSSLKEIEYKGDEFVDSVRKKTNKEYYKEDYEHLRQLSADILSRKESFVPHAPTESTPPPAIKDEDVTHYQESIENKEAYENIAKVARTYYETFYANDAEGERLRADYIDKLLMSKYPILAYPFFPEPTFYYLKMLSDRFIIPGMDEIADESIAMFKSNPAFTEAFLCGMNTEMGTELQWREYPTDRRGSYFRKFWDSESSVAAIQGDNFFDIKPLHLWGNTHLGENHLQGKEDLLIFAVKSDLFCLYPGTKVYLNKAEMKDDGSMKLGDDKIPAVMETFAREDVFLVGFKIKVLEALGNPADENYGYMLTFEQDLDDLNFTNVEDRSAFHNSAEMADALKDQVTIVAKHVSLFV